MDVVSISVSVVVYVLYGQMVVVLVNYLLFFFFKQKTAYEMRISDWSSDVCSSDLTQEIPVLRIRATFSRISASEADATRGCGSRSHDKRLCRSCTFSSTSVSRR